VDRDSKALTGTLNLTALDLLKANTSCTGVAGLKAS